MLPQNPEAPYLPPNTGNQCGNGYQKEIAPQMPVCHKTPIDAHCNHREKQTGQLDPKQRGFFSCGNKI